MEQRKKHASGCPIAYTMNLFGDRWSLLIVRDLMFLNRRTYGELAQCPEGIATNILADRLKQLESAGIIRKSRNLHNRRSYNYALTAKGCDLIPMFMEIMIWGARYDSQTRISAALIERITTDREAFISEIRSRFLES
ncbi:MAG: helix-turn-helix transcriptional regulator [Leptospiraceae bacterium]|nr:helix-turn-helix transcriptional regulator [Leptospiraceae bacterium]